MLLCSIYLGCRCMPSTQYGTPRWVYLGLSTSMKETMVSRRLALFSCSRIQAQYASTAHSMYCFSHLLNSKRVLENFDFFLSRIICVNTVPGKVKRHIY